MDFVNSLSDDERNQRVREFVRARVDSRYGTVSAYATAIGAAVSTVNEMLQGKRGAGLSLIARIAKEADTTPDVITGVASPDAGGGGGSIGGTAWGNLDGWLEAEDIVRKTDRRWTDWQYARARQIRGFNPPVPVTPAVVQQALMLVFAVTPADELERLEAERQDKELKRLQKAAETRARKAKGT